MAAEFLQSEANRFAMVPINVENEGLQGAISAYNELLMRRAELSAAARPDNLEMQRIEQRIEMNRQSLQQTMNSARESAQTAVRDIRQQMAATQSQLGQFPLQEREYINLYRQKEVKSQLYFFLLKRSEENAMMLANATPKGQIIDEAYTMSEPLGLGKKAIMLIALLLGLCIPPLWLYIRKLIYNHFENRNDVERVTDVPIIGEMCIDRSGRRLVVTADDTSSTSELFRLMRSNLLFVLNDSNDKVVLITSTSSGEGKSYISINLAATLAMLGRRTLLVGMDIRNPQLENYLGVAPRFGLTQYLASETYPSTRS